jgi:Flp pilus assembly protein TadG
MRPFQRSEKGQDLVEYALVLPLFILLVLSVVEFGYLFLQYNTVTNAAREGARAGILPVTTSCNLACQDAKATAAANTFAAAAGLHLSDLNVTVNHPSTTQVRVEVSYTTRFMTTPLMAVIGSADSFTLQSTATMFRAS